MLESDDSSSLSVSAGGQKAWVMNSEVLVSAGWFEFQRALALARSNHLGVDKSRSLRIRDLGLFELLGYPIRRENLCLVNWRSLAGIEPWPRAGGGLHVLEASM